MSSEEEIMKSLSNDSESFCESTKSSKFFYTRDFLLSLSELDICKKLPDGFDSSLLSEFEDGYHGPQDRPRNPGSLPLQSHRRTDYSSSPPTRGDSSNYSRVYGRWDNRSSVKSDRDSDAQSDKDSDSGRPYGSQYRKPWQSSEHDGLLGSGSFARPPGYVAGLSGPKGRSNDQYQLKRSSEPYQPPRPYKAGPLSRREITDSLNDETFGSSECASQDQAEEERRRRESFELMRKEQHKSLQEKQNLTTNKLEKDQASNITELVGDSDGGSKALTKLAELDESMTQAVSNNLLSKSSLQNSVARPLVPPGFRSTVVEKNSTTSLAHSSALEVGKPDVEERNSHAKTIVPIGIPVGDQEESIDPSTHAQHPSILDKLFGSVLSDDPSGSSVLVEKKDPGQDDPWTAPDVIQSSKFAQWFLEDEKKGTEGLSRTMTNDILSLIGGGKKGGSQAFNAKSPQHIPADFPFPSSEITDGHSTSNTIPSSVELPKKLYKSSKEETALPILTCEDLEQTILSGYTGSSSISQQNQVQNIFGLQESKPETDDGASQHLLSLLKRGPVLKDTVVSSIIESGFSDEKVEDVTQSGKPLTLETLFGSAFMKELQSAEAPVSALGLAVKSNINGPNSIDENNKQQSKSDNSRSLFGIYDTQVESDSFSKPGGFDGATDIQLPEEESLIAVGDPVNTRSSMFSSFGNSIDGESQSSNRPLDISDKLAVLTTGFEDERPLMRGRHGSLDRETFHNLQAQSASPQFNPAPQMNHASPFLHPLESHPTHASPPLNFNAQEDLLQRGGPRNHQFPANVMGPPFRHPSGGQAGFDAPHPILQQMQMQMQRPTPNNLPHHLQEYNRVAPLPPHLRTHAAGPKQERNPMQGFPFDQQETNFGGPGIIMQAPEVRGNHPEAFQKLLEMELRANSSKRMHPFASLGSDQGLHGHDLDSSFRYI